MIDVKGLVKDATHPSVSCGDGISLLILLEPHAIVWECHMRTDEEEVYGAICAKQELERLANLIGRESSEESNIPAGLSIYPQMNGTWDEA